MYTHTHTHTHISISMIYIYILNALFSFQRADINLLDDYSDSALHWAAYKNNGQTVSLLHYLGLTADLTDSYGSTPMHLAAAQNALQVIEYLIEV